ncbi:MAG TPA: polyprenyl synthetase family protein [Bacteroidales bacterium]|nr:polyprenyl synthetase family protein [Bacteroidales bacterium]HPS16479.1 polyprenyl synthetase family protein [Bacteroidales bacterium]
MHTAEILFEKVKEALKTVDLNGRPNELYVPISYTLSLGGKRIRPVLVLLTCEMFEGNLESAIYPAIAIEVFHNFTLLHDDIMDNAPIRRGKETVFKKWNANIAILSGDTMFALAYKYLIKTEKENLNNILEIFTNAAIEVCEGQQYDMNFETIDNVSVEDYIEMIRLKTAVLIAASMKTGAVIGKAKKQDAENIYKFGEYIGLAFQLQDDLLDVYADQDKFGKKIGGDIVTNKKTYLYIKALQDAKGDDLKKLQHYFSSTDFNAEEKVNAVKKIYDNIGVREATVKLINQYYEKALEYFKMINVPEERKNVLKKFTDQMMQRDF